MLAYSLLYLHAPRSRRASNVTSKHICCDINIHRGACGVMVIVVGNGHGDTSSNPGRD